MQTWSIIVINLACHHLPFALYFLLSFTICLLCPSGFVGSNLVETEAESEARTTWFITQRIPHWVWITGYIIFAVLAIGLVPQVRNSPLCHLTILQQTSWLW